MNVSKPDDPRWPYLSPSRDGWTWVAGPRGHLRRLLVSMVGMADAGLERTDVVLEVLRRLDGLARALDDDVLLLVTEAHHRGASWADIAYRLDRSKQTVHQRYQSRIHERRTEQLLEHDLAQAQRRARHTCTQSPASDEAKRARAFLRQQFGRSYLHELG